MWQKTLALTLLFLAASGPLAMADDAHPFADEIRAEAEKIYCVAKRAQAADLTHAQMNLRIVAA